MDRLWHCLFVAIGWCAGTSVERQNHKFDLNNWFLLRVACKVFLRTFENVIDVEIIMKLISIFVSTLALAVLVLVLVPAGVALADDQLPSEKVALYAKVILPIKPLPNDSGPTVESWISKRLTKLGEPDLRAVTPWVRLAAHDEKSTTVWTAMLDGDLWGCPVKGKVAEHTEDGKVKAELLGWSPGGASIKGQTLASELGSRRVAKVDTGEGTAYVALFVGPALVVKKLTEE